jgi:hypothetical protein
MADTQPILVVPDLNGLACRAMTYGTVVYAEDSRKLWRKRADGYWTSLSRGATDCPTSAMTLEDWIAANSHPVGVATRGRHRRVR